MYPLLQKFSPKVPLASLTRLVSTQGCIVGVLGDPGFG